MELTPPAPTPGAGSALMGGGVEPFGEAGNSEDTYK